MSYKVNGKKYYVVDVAGICDSGGTKFDFIVSFLNKKLFQKAKTVRFLVPITKVQIENNRGRDIIDHLIVLEQIYKGCIDNICDSIQPILTTVNINLIDEDEFDLDSMKSQLFGKFL